MNETNICRCEDECVGGGGACGGGEVFGTRGGGGGGACGVTIYDPNDESAKIVPDNGTCTFKQRMQGIVTNAEFGVDNTTKFFLMAKLIEYANGRQNMASPSDINEFFGILKDEGVDDKIALRVFALLCTHNCVKTLSEKDREDMPDREKLAVVSAITYSVIRQCPDVNANAMSGIIYCLSERVNSLETGHRCDYKSDNAHFLALALCDSASENAALALNKNLSAALILEYAIAAERKIMGIRLAGYELALHYMQSYHASNHTDFDMGRVPSVEPFYVL